MTKHYPSTLYEKSTCSEEEDIWLVLTVESKNVHRVLEIAHGVLEGRTHAWWISDLLNFLKSYI